MSTGHAEAQPAEAMPTLEYLEQHATKTSGEIDDDEQFMTFVDYALADGRTFRRPLIAFKKVNPFAADRGVIDTTRGRMPESELDKRLGKDEHPNATTFWVRCYARGTEELLHESRNAYAKKTFDMIPQQATL